MRDHEVRDVAIDVELEIEALATSRTVAGGAYAHMHAYAARELAWRAKRAIAVNSCRS